MPPLRQPPSAVISTLHSASLMRPDERLRREAAEHDRVRRADARAGQQRHRQLGHHAEVDRDAVALDDAEAAQHVGEAVDLVVQLAVADHALVARLADPDVGGLVAAAGREVAVEAVDRRVQLAVGEPLEERRVGVVERPGSARGTRSARRARATSRSRRDRPRPRRTATRRRRGRAPELRGRRERPAAPRAVPRSPASDPPCALLRSDRRRVA